MRLGDPAGRRPRPDRRTPCASSPAAGWRRYKIPRYVLVVDEFPMTVTGKVRKVEMRERSVQMLDLGEAAAVRTA